ncbi:MAG: J domain-containing protein [Polyangia bacterium]
MSSTSSPDLYAVLGVHPSASAEELRRAYKHLARKLHPDRNPAQDAADRFRQVADAYRVLGDPKRRAQYDRERQREATRQEPGRRNGQAGASGEVELPPEIVEPAAALFVGIVDTAASAVQEKLGQAAQTGGFFRRLGVEILRSAAGGARNIAVTQADELAARVRRKPA